MKFGILFFVGLLATASAQTAPPSKNPPNPADLCSIQGVVVKAGTGEPIHKVIVNAISENGRHGDELAQGGSAETDEMGRFEITGLVPGRYHLTAFRNGFVEQSYGQKNPGQPPISWTLVPGQTLKNVTFQLIPSGVISGHVYDEDNEPMVHVQVQALRYGFEAGQRKLEPRGQGFTNDLGEFRIFGLAPGQYFVMARSARFASWGKKDDGYTPSYYPGVPDPGRAAPVTVTAGSEFADVDFNFRTTKAYAVRGQIDASACGGTSGGGIANLTPLGPGFSPYQFGSLLHGGTFEFKGVPPGSYLILADSASPEGIPCQGRVTIEVTDSDLDGITLPVSARIAIKGRLRVEGQLDPPAGVFHVLLPLRDPNPPDLGSMDASVNPDGNFIFPVFAGGPYDLDVTGIPVNGYLKSARVDGTDVLATGLTVDAKQNLGTLEIVVSANGATLQGVVARDGQPYQGATVALVPDPPNRSQKRLYKSIGSDSNGRFVMQGIAPGDYKVFAWERIDADSWESPDVLEPFEKQGESVHINEGSNNSVQLDLIPAIDPTP
jgi:hypothetical protein